MALMRRVVVNDVNRAEVEHVKTSEPIRDQLLVRVEACGL